MNIAENLLMRQISREMKKRKPELDLWGSDRRVLQIACEDFTNYLKQHWELMGCEDIELKLEDKILSHLREKGDFEEFIYIWSGLWLKKWNDRVRIILGKRDLQRWKKANELLKKAEPVWRTLKHRNEMVDMVIDSLIRNGEICGTSIIAKSMLKIEIGLSINRKISVETREQILNIVNKVLRKAREASNSKGPLIYIRVGKRFFQLLQRTFR
jgi:hypothetical protein